LIDLLIRDVIYVSGDIVAISPHEVVWVKVVVAWQQRLSVYFLFDHISGTLVDPSRRNPGQRPSNRG
jgi:hypothetical protein